MCTRAGGENKMTRMVEYNTSEYFRSVSRYDINTAFLKKHLPMSDHVHGPYKMMPPKLLHTSGSGLIMYMFESLRHQL